MSALETLAAAASLEIPGVRIMDVGVQITDPDLPFETYEAVFVAVSKVSTASKWWIGDLVRQGEKLFGERYAQAMDVSGLSYSTVSKYTWVCGQIPFSRRRQNLRYSHHVEVAKLDPDGQDEWLAAAEANQWSVEDLRARVRDAHGIQERPEQPQWTPPTSDPPSDTPPDAPGRPLAALRAVPEVLPLPTVTALQDAARAVVDQAVVVAEGWLVPGDAIVTLRAALS